MAAARDDFASSELGPVYVLVGTEALLLSRAVETLRDRAVPEAVRAFNLDTFDGRGLTGDRLLAALQTLPMMGERRMVLVRSMDQMALSELASLIDYLDSPNPTTVWVGVCSKVDKRGKFYARCKKLGFLHELSAPRDPEAWLSAEVQRRGVGIERDAQRRLCDIVGSDLARLEGALEQLSLYAGTRSITADDVEDLIAETRERTVFELTDALGGGDVVGALAAVAALFDQRQSPVGVVVMLARHMRQLGRYHEGLALGLGKGEMAKHVGAPPFVVTKLGRQARRYSPAAVASALGYLAEADRSLKGGEPFVRTLGADLGHRVLVDRLVSRMVALGR